MSADGTETSGDNAAQWQELRDIRTRMERLKKEAAIAVEEGWQTQWRNPDVFALKVQTRLTMNPEYRVLQDKVRTLEAVLEPKPEVKGSGGMSLSDW